MLVNQQTLTIPLYLPMKGRMKYQKTILDMLELKMLRGKWNCFNLTALIRRRKEIMINFKFP